MLTVERLHTNDSRRRRRPLGTQHDGSDRDRSIRLNARQLQSGRTGWIIAGEHQPSLMRMPKKQQRAGSHYDQRKHDRERGPTRASHDACFAEICPELSGPLTFVKQRVLTCLKLNLMSTPSPKPR
jgi:hypothetical protein